MPARQDVSAGGDAYVAGRDLHAQIQVSRPQAAQFGDGNTQVNLVIGGDREAPQSAGSMASGPAGRLLADVTDPFGLEVHRAVESDDLPSGVGPLPEYVRRGHDGQLAQVVRTAAGGTSGVAVLVGGSSTGKTRACWEALALLRDQAEPWRLWHPISPSRPGAALEELGRVKPRTVVWLNEAQFYLLADSGEGERVAAGLRTLLRDPDRSPALVLATMWPEYWARLMVRPAAGTPDPHAQARELLTDRRIQVPGELTAAERDQAAAAGDPRLALAAKEAANGRVIQFLAGAPELVSRYESAPPAARALLDAAVDARRLGMGPELPRTFLEAAAPGYIADTDQDTLPPDWREQALSYAAAPCKGVRGPLAPSRPRPGSLPGPAVCQLADYLDQHGRGTCRDRIPPLDFWYAVARHASPGDLPALAAAAENRGLLRDAARIRKKAAEHGNTLEAAALVRNLHTLNPNSAEPGPAQWAATHASLDDPDAVADLLNALREAGAGQQAAALADRAAAGVPLDDPYAVGYLLNALWEVGAGQQAAALADRDPAGSVSLDDPCAVADLLNALWEVGAGQQAAALADRAAAGVPLDDPYAVGYLLNALWEVGAGQQAAALADRDPAGSVSLDDPDAVADLLNVLLEVGAGQQAAALADRAASVPVGDPDAADQQAAALANRAAASVPVGDPDSVAYLLHVLRRAGADQQFTALADRAVGVSLNNPRAVANLLNALRGAGADQQRETLISRLPAEGLFHLFRQEADHEKQYRFGREADGRPAPEWSWMDLE
jgi:hypothetical protein